MTDEAGGTMFLTLTGHNHDNFFPNRLRRMFAFAEPHLSQQDIPQQARNTTVGKREPLYHAGGVENEKLWAQDH